LNFRRVNKKSQAPTLIRQTIHKIFQRTKRQFASVQTIFFLQHMYEQTVVLLTQDKFVPEKTVGNHRLPFKRITYSDINDIPYLNLTSLKFTKGFQAGSLS